MERYDRQLRLWGPLGQDNLNQARVCVLGPATPLLQEIAKNLVLAGISSLTWLKEKSAVQSGPLFLADLKGDLEPLTSQTAGIRGKRARRDLNAFSLRLVQFFGDNLDLYW